MTADPRARIAEIWTDSLGIPVIAPDHDFFGSGGDSFQAALVTAHVRREWGLDVTVQLLIDHPLLGDFATRVACLLERPDTGGNEP